MVRMVCNGTHPGDWQRVSELAREYPEVVPSFGLHPWFCAEALPDWPAQLASFLDRGPAAIGEIGLDRWLKNRDEPAQESAFRTQLAIARERRLPVTIHCLRAWGWLTDVLRQAGPLPAGFLLHAYSGPRELIPSLARAGAFFSFAGNVLHPNRLRARAALQEAPLDRLLIETDAPALSPPRGYRPYTLTSSDGDNWNEPANLRAILEGIADLRQITPDELAETVLHNATRLFGDLLCLTNAS